MCGTPARRRRSALRSAPFHGAGQRDSWRHGGEHPGARSAGDLGISLPARPRPKRSSNGEAPRAARSCRNTSAARRKRRSTRTLHARYPGLVMDEDSPAVALARELTGANQVEAVAYGTEAGHFQRYGIPAVICGPGSIDQAHRPDEFCALSELEACEAFLRKVIANWADDRRGTGFRRASGPAVPQRRGRRIARPVWPRPAPPNRADRRNAP
jgi:hypothetical protein